MIGRVIVAAVLAVTLVGPAFARTEIRTSPGPFKGYSTSTVRQDGGSVIYCTSRPGPFKGQRQTSCQ